MQISGTGPRSRMHRRTWSARSTSASAGALTTAMTEAAASPTPRASPSDVHAPQSKKESDMLTDTTPHTVTIRTISATSHEVTCYRCAVLAAGHATQAATETDAHWP